MLVVKLRKCAGKKGGGLQDELAQGTGPDISVSCCATSTIDRAATAHLKVLKHKVLAACLAPMCISRCSQPLLACCQQQQQDDGPVKGASSRNVAALSALAAGNWACHLNAAGGSLVHHHDWVKQAAAV